MRTVDGTNYRSSKGIEVVVIDDRPSRKQIHLMMSQAIADNNIDEYWRLLEMLGESDRSVSHVKAPPATTPRSPAVDSATGVITFI